MQSAKHELPNTKYPNIILIDEESRATKRPTYTIQQRKRSNELAEQVIARK